MRSQTITRTFVLTSLLSLPLFTIACGDDNSEKTKTLEECEKVCLDTDACDDTFANPGGDYCADYCATGWDGYEELGCTAEFQAIATCKAAGNSCPVPDCPAETRDLVECVEENTPVKPVGEACETVCSIAAECANAPDDFDVDACEQSCEGDQDAAEDLGCGAEYEAYLGCVDVCDAEAGPTDCPDELDALSVCAAG